MGIFRRSRDSDSRSSAIVEFWVWWDEAGPRVEAALPDGLSGELAAELTERVEAIDPDLTWEVGSGPSLTLTGDGEAELRGVTERWRLAAPPSDWSFHAARQPDPAMLTEKLTLDDDEFDLEYVRLGLRADAQRGRVDVAAYHPDFLFVPDETKQQVTNRVLNWALGEDDVVRWIGEVDAVAEAPQDALPASMLSAVVEQVSAPFSEETWLAGEGRTPLGHAARVAVRFPLHRPDHPLCDLHVAVSVPYANANPDRLPVEPSASALREFEKSLTRLGDGVVLAAHETGDGHRVYHLYADPDSGAVSELDQLAAGWSEGRATVASQSDPAWQALAPYRP